MNSTWSTAFHPLLANKFGELWSTNQKVIDAHVDPPNWTFWETVFRPLGVLAPQIFTHHTTPKMFFKSDVGRRAASCWALLHFPISSLFLISHRISEFPRPIATKLCHVIGICADQIMQVHKFGEPKTCKIWTDLHNILLGSRISPERDKISKLWKICDLERFLPRSAKQVWWTLVHYPESRTCEFGRTQINFFDRLYFGP